MIDIKKVDTPNVNYTAKVIPLAFDESMSYYQCICNIANHINNEVLPVVNDMEETVITLSNDFKDLQDYVDDNMITKDVDDLTYYTKTSDLSTVATTGDYNDLSNKPTIPDVSNFITKDVNDLTNYTLTSNLASVATTGSYNDLTNTPTIPDVSNFITKDVNDLTNYTLTTSLATVATSGSYNDLTNKPTIPDVSNFITKDVNDLTNYTLTSDLSSVATSGSYTDLSNKPTIPTVPTNVSSFNNDSGYITKSVNDLTYYTLTSNLSTVATSGSYNDLSNKPTIPSVSSSSITDKLVNSWSANGQCIVGKVENLKFIQLCIRNGTTNIVTNNLPTDYRPSETTIIGAQTYTSVGYAIIDTDGKITLESSMINDNVIISGYYI